jgi:hypothetical protein
MIEGVMSVEDAAAWVAAEQKFYDLAKAAEEQAKREKAVAWERLVAAQHELLRAQMVASTIARHGGMSND